MLPPLDEGSIRLKRQYEDEILSVQVDIPNITAEENEVEDAYENEKTEFKSSIPLAVTAFEGNRVSLEFGLAAFPDEVSIDNL
ncbi:hypothetical protein RYX36_030762 [Vicia faba]